MACSGLLVLVNLYASFQRLAWSVGSLRGIPDDANAVGTAENRRFDGTVDAAPIGAPEPARVTRSDSDPSGSPRDAMVNESATLQVVPPFRSVPPIPTADQAATVEPLHRERHVHDTPHESQTLAPVQTLNATWPPPSDTVNATDFPLPLATVQSVLNDTILPVQPVHNDTSIAVHSVHDTDQVIASDTSHLAYLPLLPWEQQSLETRECTPPTHTPDYCCVGSISRAGHMLYERHGCDKGAETYARNEQMALASLSQLSVVGGTAPQVECDWCRIIDLLLAHNWTMAFMGDSITGQSFFGAECELRRRSGLYHVESRVEPRKESHEFGLVTVTELRVSRMHASRSTDTVDTALLRYYLVYRPRNDAMELDEIRIHHDVLLFDHGLHYDPSIMADFESEMASMISTLLQDSKQWKLLAWRETSAQHYDSLGGRWKRESPACVPMNQHQNGTVEDPTQTRYAVMTRLVHAHHGTNPVALLPFWNYSSQFHNLHAGPVDCSHFCTMPSLWLYQWRTIRNALEGAVAVAVSSTA